MHEIIKSVGIDIGTSTTQLIFSELTIENEASNYVVPRINIVDKKMCIRDSSGTDHIQCDCYIS